MGNLTVNFSLVEFAASDSFPNLAAAMEFSDFEAAKCFWLAATILEPTRAAVGAPGRITSGKRSPELLAALTAAGYPTSQTSDHLFYGPSVCADVTFGSHEKNRDAFEFIRNRLPYAFGQLIRYVNAAGSIRHLHVSLPTPSNIGEVLEKPDGAPIRVLLPGHPFAATVVSKVPSKF